MTRGEFIQAALEITQKYICTADSAPYGCDCPFCQTDDAQAVQAAQLLELDTLFSAYELIVSGATIAYLEQG